MYRVALLVILITLVALVTWRRSHVVAPAPGRSSAEAVATPLPTDPGSPAMVPTPLSSTPLSPVASPLVAASPTPCGYGRSAPLAELKDRAVREASALVASRRTPGAYWTLNDSGNDPLLFAFDELGRSLGTVRVDNATNVDWEALQPGPGPDGGFALYIGDTGDNQSTRRQSVVYRVPEPELSLSIDKPVVGRTAPPEAFRFVFPDAPHDTEAMLVHPRTGELLLITKEYTGLAHVFRMPPPLDARQISRLEAVAELDLRFLGPLVSAVTDAAVSADARRVVLRTYLYALEYDLPEGAPMASIWGEPPRLYRLDDGPQGEGITYRLDRRALLTIGESVPAILYQNDWRC